MSEHESESAVVPRSHFALAVGLVVVGCAVPLVLYWLLLGGIESDTPEEARKMLREHPNDHVLVDVRDKESFAARHLQAAINWPLDTILETGSIGKNDPLKDAPAEVHDKTLILICDVGQDSRRAARHLASWRACYVRGGLLEWVHSSRHEPKSPLDTWVSGSGSEIPIERSSPLYEQALAVLAFFLLKPIYTIASLGLVIVLWPNRSPDLAALRWAMVFFFIGESSCAVNFLAFEERSYLAEYLHSMGMVLAFGFGSYALLDGLDRRLVMLSDPRRRCAALGLCGRCIKHADVPCGLRRVFCIVLPLAMLFALLLPTAGWHNTVYITQIFGFPYVYGHLFVFQMFENWFCGGAAFLLFAIALIILLVRKQPGIEAAKIFFATGLGPLAFGALHVLLNSAYDQNRVWFLFWEECAEFALIASVCAVLGIFHRRLPLWINQLPAGSPAFAEASMT
jgi:rhodanese-related sulfurtransferase